MRLAAAILLALTCAASAQMPLALDVMPPYGAAGEWRFLDGQQTSDESGNGGTGTLTNGAMVAAGILILTNSSAPATMCILDADALTPSNELTIAFWARPNCGDWTVIGKEGGTTDRAYYVRYDSTRNRGLIFVVSADGTTFSEHQTGSAYQHDGAWAHIACVFVGNASTKIYFNGVDTSASLVSGSQQAYIRNNSAPLCLGRRRDGITASTKYEGSLTRVYVYPRSLNIEEIQQLYLEGPP